MKAPRTPGPWNVSEGHTLTITAEGVDVATVDAPRDRYAEGVANAYLIAAALRRAHKLGGRKYNTKAAFSQ